MIMIGAVEMVGHYVLDRGNVVTWRKYCSLAKCSMIRIVIVEKVGHYVLMLIGRIGN